MAIPNPLTTALKSFIETSMYCSLYSPRHNSGDLRVKLWMLRSTFSFTEKEIEKRLKKAGFKEIQVSIDQDYWGRRHLYVTATPNGVVSTPKAPLKPRKNGLEALKRCNAEIALAVFRIAKKHGFSMTFDTPRDSLQFRANLVKAKA